MFEKSSQELAVNKLLILYILNKMEIPLTNTQITQIILENEVMNYFALQQFIIELLNKKLIENYDDKEQNKVFYQINQNGIKALELFHTRIPNDVKEKFDSYLQSSKEAILKDMQIKANYLKVKENEFIVSLKVIENQTNLINIDLNVTSKAQAKYICDNWKENSSTLYGDILNILIKE